MSLASNNPNRKSWVEVPEGSDFSIQNLPFGILSRPNGKKKVGVAIGEYALDVAALYDYGYLDLNMFSRDHFQNEFLNDLISLGKEKNTALRERISYLLSTETDELKSHAKRDEFLVKSSELVMHMPVRVGDYTDFYSSEEHARNVGTMFRDPKNALLPNWKHMPVAYHGRSSSIIPSGQPIHRPMGQMKADGEENPTFGPTQRLDIELEMAFITYPGKPIGQSISTTEAMDHIFGMVLFNDWSARDIQKWEYVPLGPFLAKNFASSISLWVVTMDALAPYQVAGPQQSPKVLPYLEYSGEKNYDINLDVFLTPESGTENHICHSNFKYMYWNMNQQLAHHTVNGCPVNAGDMMASGTISGPDESSYGSMLELAWKGTKPIKLNDGTERKFVNDGDTITIRGFCERDGVRIGFGDVTTKISNPT